MFYKIGALCKNFCNIQNEKDTSTQTFSCEYCEIFKKQFFYKAPLVAASAFF